MKINSGYQDSRAASAQDAAKTQETAAAAQARASKGEGAGRGGSADEVSLSSLASALQGALSDSPERAAYIERLAGEYAAGTYQPDAEATARAILRDAAKPPDPAE